MFIRSAWTCKAREAWDRLGKCIAYDFIGCLSPGRGDGIFAGRRNREVWTGRSPQIEDELSFRGALFVSVHIKLCSCPFYAPSTPRFAHHSQLQLQFLPRPDCI
jgi:hypothetical protein